jgi:hypothetical protein
MAFWGLFSTAISSVVYGIVITAAIMAILYGVLKALSDGIVRSVPFFITGVVMAVLLTIQCSLLVGAIEAKSVAGSMEIYLNQQLEGQQGIVGARDSQEIMNNVIDHFPIIGTYLGIANFAGHEISDIAQVMHDTMVDYLNTYIWHRVFWILGIIVVGCVVVLFFDKPNVSAGRRLAGVSRHDGSRARTGRHQRVSRRR